MLIADELGKNKHLHVSLSWTTATTTTKGSKETNKKKYDKEKRGKVGKGLITTEDKD